MIDPTRHRWLSLRLKFSCFISFSHGVLRVRYSLRYDKRACLKDVVDYAASKKVKVLIWVHSREVFTPQDRKAYFDTTIQAGAAGIEIDFPPKANVAWATWYTDTLRDAADLKLLIDFHDAVKPTGRDRTWPNEITREGIRGQECNVTRYKRQLPPERDTILPFNRFVQGYADYMPTALNPKELLGFTWVHEIAKPIIFSSPFLCYADHPTFYLKNPALDIIKAIPATFDQTVLLPGSKIGSAAAFARRSGDRWFVGILNGAEPQQMNIPLGVSGPRHLHHAKAH